MPYPSMSARPSRTSKYRRTPTFYPPPTEFTTLSKRLARAGPIFYPGQSSPYEPWNCSNGFMPCPICSLPYPDILSIDIHGFEYPGRPPPEHAHLQWHSPPWPATDVTSGVWHAARAISRGIETAEYQKARARFNEDFVPPIVVDRQGKWARLQWGMPWPEGKAWLSKQLCGGEVTWRTGSSDRAGTFEKTIIAGSTGRRGEPSEKRAALSEVILTFESDGPEHAGSSSTSISKPDESNGLDKSGTTVTVECPTKFAIVVFVNKDNVSDELRDITTSRPIPPSLTLVDYSKKIGQLSSKMRLRGRQLADKDSSEVEDINRSEPRLNEYPADPIYTEHNSTTGYKYSSPDTPFSSATSTSSNIQTTSQLSLTQTSTPISSKMSSRTELPTFFDKSKSEPVFLLSHSENSGGVRIDPVTKTTYELLALLREKDTPTSPTPVGQQSAISPNIAEKRRLFREAVAAARIRHQSAFEPRSARKEEKEDVEVGEFGDWKTEHTPSFVNAGTSSSWTAPASSRSKWIEFSAPGSSPSGRGL